MLECDDIARRLSGIDEIAEIELVAGIEVGDRVGAFVGFENHKPVVAAVAGKVVVAVAAPDNIIAGGTGQHIIAIRAGGHGGLADQNADRRLVEGAVGIGSRVIELVEQEFGAVEAHDLGLARVGVAKIIAPR